MEFLGIGPLELLFIVIVVIVVIGPRDIQKTMRTLGRALNSLYKSEGWKAFTEVSRQVRTLPNRLAREAELEEVQKTARELNQEIAAANPSMAAWTAASQEKKKAPASPSISMKPKSATPINARPKPSPAEAAAAETQPEAPPPAEAPAAPPPNGGPHSPELPPAERREALTTAPDETQAGERNPGDVPG
jgi:Sec-independent protein translocase protein TatA